MFLRVQKSRFSERFCLTLSHGCDLRLTPVEGIQPSANDGGKQADWQQ
jgi:hypothetical protein